MLNFVRPAFVEFHQILMIFWFIFVLFLWLYNRNPGGTQIEPWCFVDRSSTDQSTDVHDIARELCNIEKCSDKMWLYIISTFIVIGLIIIIITTILCCKKYRKRGMTNIQNVSVWRAGE